MADLRAASCKPGQYPSADHAGGCEAHPLRAGVGFLPPQEEQHRPGAEAVGTLTEKDGNGALFRPGGLNKRGLLGAGMDLMRQFCLANGLSLPRVDVVEPARWRYPSTCAYYRADVITICVERCAHIGSSGMAWSYPGYVIDRTPYGVIQHELGHHADFTRSDLKGAYGGDFSAKMRAATGEPKLTNYCPNDWEWFAEMFRLFVTNSNLLLAVRPRTHAAIVDAGFRPVVDRPWREVLADAPPRTIEQAGRKAVQ